jgi:ribosome-associated protein
MAKSATTSPARRRTPRPRLPADIRRGATAALDKKATDVVVLDLRKTSAFTDFFIIATGRTTRQVQAVADAVREAFGDRGMKPALVEGYERADWVLIDYFDFIVHVFTPATREFYSLERLWGDARRVELPAD